MALNGGCEGDLKHEINMFDGKGIPQEDVVGILHVSDRLFYDR